MCCCNKPNINGEQGYNCNNPNGQSSIRPVDPPKLEDGDTILFDEPGRCGGIDSHSFHYRLITRYGDVALLVRHGMGDECISHLANGKAILNTLQSLDSNGRYWLFNAIFHAQSDSARRSKESTSEVWRKAAAEKRIKTRKYPVKGIVKVWIE